MCTKHSPCRRFCIPNRAWYFDDLPFADSERIRKLVIKEIEGLRPTETLTFNSYWSGTKLLKEILDVVTIYGIPTNYYVYDSKLYRVYDVMNYEYTAVKCLKTLTLEDMK